MKYLTLFAHLFILVQIGAQPTLTSDVILQLGTSVPATYNEGALAISNNGPNQNWVFPEELNTETYNTNLTIIESENAPFTDLFPEATFSILNEDVFVYSHFKIEDNQLISVGFDLGDDSFGGLTYTTLDPGEAVLKWPLTYLDEWSSETMFVQYILGNKVNMGTRQYKAVVSGYGSVQTPIGNYDNILKVEVDYINSGELIDQILFFHPSSMIPLVAVEPFGNGDFGYTYIDISGISTSTKELEEENKIRATYSDGCIHISHPKLEQLSDVVLTNSSGVSTDIEIRKANYNTIINPEQKPTTGVYFISLAFENQLQTVKIFIP